MKNKYIFLLCALIFSATLYNGFAEAHEEDEEFGEGVHDSELEEIEILPGDAFYPLKKAIEAIGTALTFGAESKIRRDINLAEKRISETRQLVLKEVEFSLIEKSMDMYEERMNSATLKAVKLAEKNQDKADKMLKEIFEAETKSLSAVYHLDEISDKKYLWFIEKMDARAKKRDGLVINTISPEQKKSIEEELETERHEIEIEIKSKAGEILSEREIIREKYMDAIGIIGDKEGTSVKKDGEKEIKDAVHLKNFEEGRLAGI